MIKNIIWDFDGTLFDTYPAFIRAYCDAMRQFNAPVVPEQVEPLVHKSLSHTARVLALRAGLEVDQVQHAFDLAYAAIPPGDQPLFPGAREMLDAVIEFGGMNLLVTHRGAKSTFRLLAAHDIDILFRDVVTPEDGFPRKPAPDAFTALVERFCLDPDLTLALGDRDLDVLAGWAAGLRTGLFRPYHVNLVADLRVDEYHALRRFLDRLNGLSAGQEADFWPTESRRGIYLT